MPKLLADDPRALRLSELARSLSEHLCAIGWEPVQRSDGRRVMLHPHCHQRAAIGTDADRAVLARAGFTVDILDAGCCGLAGSFGFRAEHDAISRRIAETAFLPALRDLDPDVTVVIDGFSCRTQAQQLHVRVGSSLAELLLETTVVP